MSGPNPLGGGNPFEASFGELVKLFSNKWTVSIQITGQMA